MYAGEKPYAVVGKIAGRSYDNAVPDLRRGDRITTWMLLSPIGISNKSAKFDYGRYMASRGFYVKGYIPSFALIEKKGTSLESLLAIPETVRRRLLALVDEMFPAEKKAALPPRAKRRGSSAQTSKPSTEAALLKTILLGDRRDLSRQIKSSFTNSGTGHLLAISGLHVGIIAWLIWIVLRFVGVNRRFCALITIVLITCYLPLTGFRTSAVRAVIMLSIYMGGILLGRERDPLNTLALAAFVILLIHPGSLFEAGFQLSFAAVFFIVVLWHGIVEVIHDPVYQLTDSRWGRIKMKCWRNARFFFAVAVAACVGSMPLVIYYFKIFTPWSIVANLLTTSLLFPVVVFFSVLTLALASVSTVLAVPLIYITKLLLGLLIWIVDCLAALPLASVTVMSVPLAAVILYYTVHPLALLKMRPRPRLICSIAALVVFLGVVYIAYQF